MKRTVVLLALLMAVVLMLSAPLAEAKKKHKHKKHHHRPPATAPAFNVVNCTLFVCRGTSLSDFLVGTDSDEKLLGEEGNDIYRANGGDDSMFDNSLTSNDLYTGYAGDFGPDLIIDDGGSADFLDLSSLRALDDVTITRGEFVITGNNTPGNDLRLQGSGNNEIVIGEHFAHGRIETIRFANFTITSAQTESLARQTTPEEQAALKEQLQEHPAYSGETAQEEASS